MMPLPVSLQLSQAGLSLLLGMVLGLWYDLLKALRLRGRRRWLTDLLDLLFWLPAGLLLFVLGMGPGEGQLRIFMVLSTCCGAVLYFCLFSRRFLVLAGCFWGLWATLGRILVKPLGPVVEFRKKYTVSRKNTSQIQGNGLK